MSTLFSHLRQQGAKLWAICDDTPTDLDIKHIRRPHTDLPKLLIKEGANTTIVDSSTYFVEYPDKILIALCLVFKKVLSFYWIKIIHDGTLPARHKHFTKLQKLFFNMSLHFVDEVIVVNEELQMWLKQDIKIIKPVSCIKSLLPLPIMNDDPTIPDHAAQFIRRYDKIVCSIGVFIDNYGFKQVADAVELIRDKKGLDVGLLLIDGTFACNIHYKSDVLYNRPWITVAENVSHSATLKLLRKSDVFVRALASESYGLSRVEALWCGTPVVATRVGEMRGMLLFDYGHNTDLVTQILEALFNPLVKGDIHGWAELFQKEANNNLNDLINALTKELRLLI